MTGFSGWKITLSLCAIYFLSLGFIYYGYAAVLPAMIKDLGWSRGDASLGFAMLSVVAGFTAPLAAYSIRRMGARNTIIAGGGVSALGALITYSTHSLAQYYAGVGIVLAVGVTLQSLVPGGQVLANWFLRRRALTMGLFLSMGGIGAFIAAPTVAYIIKVTGDWRSVWLVLGSGPLLASLVAYLFVHNRPEDIGQHQDGVDPARSSEIAGRTPVKKSAVYQTVYQWTMPEAFRTRELWYIIIAFTLAAMGMAIAISQSLIFLQQDRGIDPLIAGSALGTVGLLGVAGRLSGGVLGDYLEPRFIMAAGLTLQLIGMVLLNYSDTAMLVYMYAMMSGLGYGLSYLSLPTLIANYYSAHDYARLVSTAYLIIVPLSAAGPVIAGYTYDLIHSYTVIFLGFSALEAVPVLLMLMMRPPMPRAALSS